MYVYAPSAANFDSWRVLWYTHRKWCPCTTVHIKSWAHLWVYMHRTLFTPLPVHVYNQMCSHLCTWLHFLCPIQTWKHKGTEHWWTGFFLFFIYSRYIEAICKFPLETWLRAFQACFRGSPFRNLFLHFILSQFQMARFHLLATIWILILCLSPSLPSSSSPSSPPPSSPPPLSLASSLSSK